MAKTAQYNQAQLPTGLMQMGMNITTLKYVSLAALFVTTFVFSLLPLRIVSTLRNTLDPDKRAQYTKLIGFLNCFGGGVFLATAFLDLIPEVVDLIHQAMPEAVFPFAEFLIAIGFFMILSIEQIIVSHKEISTDSLTPIERLEARNIEPDPNTLKRNSSTPDESVRAALIRALQEQELEEHQTNFHSIFLLFALSLHSVFEGLAIGLQIDFNTLVEVLIAVLIHKIPVAFSVGLNLMQSELNWKSVIHLSLWFSLMTPIGLMFALSIDELCRNYNRITLVNGVLQGLAAGTFIFIVFMEILPKELKTGRDRLLKLLSVIVGFSFIAIAILWEAHHSK